MESISEDQNKDQGKAIWDNYKDIMSTCRGSQCQRFCCKPDVNYEIIEGLVTAKEADLSDRAFGAILGAFIGDSCGSYLEFMEKSINESGMNIAMSMPGGGPHEVGEGQITDDSELAMCAMWALVNPNLKRKQNDFVLDTNYFSLMYREWVLSQPFDIGMATENALQPLVKKPCQAAAKQISQVENGKSKSNGSLMRITPMAVWTSKMTNRFEVMRAICTDVEFIHHNELVKQACQCYTFSMHYLLNNPTNKNRAFEAYAIALKFSESEFGNFVDRRDGSNLKEWLDESARLAQEAEQ